MNWWKDLSLHATIGQITVFRSLKCAFVIYTSFYPFLNESGFLSKNHWFCDGNNLRAVAFQHYYGIFLYYRAAYPAITSFCFDVLDNWRHNYTNSYEVEGFNCYFTVIYLNFKTKKAIAKDDYSEINVKLPNDLLVFYFLQYFPFTQPSPGPSKVNSKNTR